LDRQIVYPGQIPLETDLLNTNRYTMIALGKLTGAIFGTATNVVNGLAVVPTGPASLNVNVNQGEIYSLQNVDNTAYSSLPADTTDTVVKQGVLLQAATLACAAPSTAGFSINYLIEATYQDADTGSVVLPYYNASNPSQAYSGPNNSGTAQNTKRAGSVVLQAKAGIAAATGTQTTPAVDAGYVALAVVTVANGQSTITSGNITAVTGNTLPADLLHAIQNNQLIYAKDTGTANTCVVSLQPAPAALLDGLLVEFQVAVTNTGAATLNLNGLGAKPILGGAHLALQGGELVANGKAQAMYHGGLASWVLLSCTGGAEQVGTASGSNQAMPLGQATGRLIGVQVFGTAGTSTYTPTAGTTKCRVTVIAGGGSGGGATATTSGQLAVGGGGGGGGYSIGLFPVASLTGQTITVGAGGAAAAGVGNAGGNSSIGAVLSAIGGFGGSFGSAGVATIVQAGGVGGTGSVGGYVAGAGGNGQPAIGFTTANFVSGAGGSSLYTGGGQGRASTTGNGLGPAGPGCGSGGAASANGTGGFTSAAGAAGLVLIEEYY
jgi:hypothetical protein